jgi:hypothetical protein
MCALHACHSEVACTTRCCQARSCAATAPQARPAGWQGAQRGLPRRRLLDGRWHGQPGADVVREFLRLLAICHTVIPEGGATPDTIRYQARPRAPPCLTPALPMRRGRAGRSLYL